MNKRLTGILTFPLTLALTAALALPAFAAAGVPPIAPAPDAPDAAAAEEEAAFTGYPVTVDGTPASVRAHVTVPLRAVAERLGFTVTWDSGMVTVAGPDRYAELTVGEDRYFAAPTQEGVAGASCFSLGCAPYVSGGVTYVPVELFDAVLGCKEGTVTLEGNAVQIRTEPDAENAVQIPSPFTSHATLAEAAGAVGFELAVPEKVNGSPLRDIETMDGKMIQVFYGEDEDEICVRKEAGAGDISGDYNRYAQVEVKNGVTMKGADGLVMVALWEKDGYTYAVTARGGMGVSAMAALVRSAN